MLSKKNYSQEYIKVVSKSMVGQADIESRKT